MAGVFTRMIVIKFCFIYNKNVKNYIVTIDQISLENILMKNQYVTTFLLYVFDS